MTTYKPILNSRQQADDLQAATRACFAQEVTGNGKRELFDCQSQYKKVDGCLTDFPFGSVKRQEQVFSREIAQYPLGNLGLQVKGLLQEASGTAFVAGDFDTHVQDIAQLGDVAGAFLEQNNDESGDKLEMALVQRQKGLQLGDDFRYFGQWQPLEEAATLFCSSDTASVSCVPYRGPPQHCIRCPQFLVQETPKEYQNLNCSESHETSNEKHDPSSG